MDSEHFALFGTTIGACAILWGPAGVRGVMLPEPDEARTRARLLRRSPGAAEAEPPPQIRAAIDAMTALLAGEPADLSWIELDMAGMDPFHRRACEAAREIAPGRTVTYGQLAARLGEPGAAQAVGQAMGRNPFPIIVPCHRVLAAGGRTGGFSAPGGARTKLKMLEIEGALAPEALPLFAAAGR